MKKLLPIPFVLFLLSGCGTTKLTCEIKIPKTTSEVDGVSLVQNTSIASGLPTELRSDDKFNYFEYSSLLHGDRNPSLIITFKTSDPERTRSEIFVLDSKTLRRKNRWSSFLSPTYVKFSNEGSGHGVDFDAVYGKGIKPEWRERLNHSSQVRFMNEKWSIDQAPLHEE